MPSKDVIHTMIKRQCEEDKIILEETLAEGFFNIEIIKEGKHSFRQKILKLLEIADKELESWTRRVPHVKFMEPSKIIVFGLKNTAEALSILVKDVNFWILDFLDALPSEKDWQNHSEVFYALHKLLDNALNELSTENALRFKISEENKKIILKVLEAQKAPYQFSTPTKNSKLSLKKRKRSGEKN